MALVFQKNDRVILVESHQVVLTVQELLNAIRIAEDDSFHMDIPKFADAFGKQDLGGGVLVGITMVLLDNWRVQFEDRPGPATIVVSITGGNLVAINDFSNNPVKASTFTQVQITSSSSATIAELEIIDLVHRIESLRVSHSRFGSNIYWDPIGGDDAFEGESPTNAVVTFSRAHTLASADVGDTIYCLTRSATSDSVDVDESITITKSGISVRGPGENFRFLHDTGAGANSTVTIKANNISMSGFTIEHSIAGALDAIDINGAASVGGVANNIQLENIFIRNVKRNGITINNSSNSELKGVIIENTTLDGLQLNNNIDDLTITDMNIANSGQDAINLVGTGILNTIFVNNILHNSTFYGMRIGTGSTKAIIRDCNYFFDNTIGDILDNGTNTSLEASSANHDKFNEAVTIDTANGVSGTEFPIGTPTVPVDNIIDARIIADKNSLTKYVIKGSIAIHQDHINWDFSGITPVNDSVDLGGTSSFSVDGSLFTNLGIDGNLIGEIEARECTLNDVTNLDGQFRGCTFLGTTTIAAGGSVFMFNCTSGGALAGTIDLIGSIRTVGAVGMRGDWIIENIKTPAGIVEIDFDSGAVILSATCTGGIAILRGTATLTDNSAGTTITRNLTAWDEPLTAHELPGSWGKRLIERLKLKRTKP